MTDEVLHVRQVGTVGAEVVFDALFVADIDEDTLEDTRARALVQRDRDAALEHVLQQSDGLQADGFPSGVRSGDDEQSAFAVEREVKGNDGLTRFAVGEE